MTMDPPPPLPQIGDDSAMDEDDDPSSSFRIDVDTPKDGEGTDVSEESPRISRANSDSIKLAVANVSQVRSMLQNLGDRPDYESLDLARKKMSEIDAKLSKQLEEIVLEPRPEETDRFEWRNRQAEKEKECRLDADKEKFPYKAVIQLEEMHATYSELLKEAEEKLENLYNVEGTESEFVPAGDEVNEEVVQILREASEKKIEHVTLSGRMLRRLPEAFGKLRNLVTLNISKNQLEVIPDSIAGLQNMVELYLSSNLLVFLPDSIGLLVNLKILDVSANKLKALPDSISRCRSLVVLNASFNGLTYLPTNLGYELVKLEKLLVHLNKIRSLPSSICEMKSMRQLDARFNELRGLPLAIGKLSNLEVLNLASNFNDLTELPQTIGNLINLKELDISNNQIQMLPESFGRLEKLVKLNLDGNPLMIPPNEVVVNGVEAVKEYMAKRWVDLLVEEEQKCVQQASAQAPTGLMTRSTSWLNNWVSGLAGNVANYITQGVQSPRDPVLDQQL